MDTSRLRTMFVVAPAVALGLASCGGDSAVETQTSAAASGESAGADITSIGEANIDLLQPADDARDVEVLNVQDGSITSLRDAVTGDRPVLLWFYAPH
jgi:uncharacterized spore protein YtfJ